jgi:cytochrome c553
MQISRKLFTLLSFTALGFAIPCFAVTAEDGAKILSESCSGCHSAKVRSLDNVRMPREQWQETVDRMIDQGAEVPKGKKSELLDYLANTHGPAVTAAGADKK